MAIRSTKFTAAKAATQNANHGAKVGVKKGMTSAKKYVAQAGNRNA